MMNTNIKLHWLMWCRQKITYSDNSILLQDFASDTMKRHSTAMVKKYDSVGLI